MKYNQWAKFAPYGRWDLRFATAPYPNRWPLMRTEDVSKYDTSWDEDDEDAWDKIYQKWKKRDWETWLKTNLSFPFAVTREEDDRDFRPDYNGDEPFTLGHMFNIEGIEIQDEIYGIIVRAKEGRQIGHVPLCDLEVASKEDENYWPVREYVVWFANR